MKVVLRLILGLLFIFSGGVKLIDPKGTQIKLQEYFYAFAKLSEVNNWVFLSDFFKFLVPFALGLALVLCVLEVVMGVAILLWFKPKWTMWTTILLLIFFGFLTGYSSQCDPNNSAGVSCVTDCGCFGDFIKLKPIQSFYKDLIFLALALPLFFMSFKEKIAPDSRKTNAVIWALAISLGFGLYNVLNEPIIDFRPYKIGNDLLILRNDFVPAKMEYQVEIDGKVQQLKQLPEGVKYKFLETVEVTPEKPATIHDFYLYNSNGDDITDSILKQDKCILLVIKSEEDLEQAEITQLKTLLEVQKETLILSSDSKENLQKHILQEFNYFSLDETVVKAMVRNYPSVLVLEKGVIKEKISLSNYEKEYL